MVVNILQAVEVAEVAVEYAVTEAVMVLEVEIKITDPFPALTDWQLGILRVPVSPESAICSMVQR